MPETNQRVLEELGYTVDIFTSSIQLWEAVRTRVSSPLVGEEGGAIWYQTQIPFPQRANSNRSNILMEFNTPII